MLFRSNSHINSVEKTSDGNYLVSSRHMCSIFKISKDEGAVIWRLGGPKSSFEMGPGAIFSFQHHARIMKENGTMTIISLLDNGAGSWPNAVRRSPYSRGLIVALDHSTSPMSARLLRSFDNPDRRTAIAKGSMQRLPNGNMLVGWGQAGALSEVTPDGKLVLHAKFSTPGVASYRAYKYNYTATPEDPPDLWTYSLDPSSPMVFYVSWNGATEVHSWNFYTCDTSGADYAAHVGSELKKGFETIHHSSQSHAWTFAEAVSIDGKSLANSTCISTFVPSLKLRSNCRTAECSIPATDTMQLKENSLLALSSTFRNQLPSYHGNFGILGSSLVAFCLGMAIPLLWRSGVGSILRARRFKWKGFQRLVNEED